MEKETENFLKAEESANQLIKTLEKLHNEANSYQNATRDLTIARDNLLELIRSVESVITNSSDIIKLLKKIGGPEILESIGNAKNDLLETISNENKSIIEKNSETENLLTESISNMENVFSEKFSKLENKIEEINKKNISYLKKIQIFVVLILIISLILTVLLIYPEYILELKKFLP